MDLRDIPRAKGYKIAFCGACPNAHLIFEGFDGFPICQAVIAKDQCRSIIRLIDARDPNFKESPLET